MNRTAYLQPHAARRSPLTPLLIVVGFVLLAPLFGLVAVSSDPVAVGLATAAIVGAALLARPGWLLWLIFLLGLFVAGVVPIWAEGSATKVVWAVALLGFGVMALAVLRPLTVPGSTRGTPAFVWVGLVFVVYTVLNGLAHFDSAYQFLGGFKRYFQAAGLLFALAWLPIDEPTIKRWRKLFLVVALFQLPWAAYELLRLVPIRTAMRAAYPGMVPIDVVAGTFGANMTSGGANGEMAAFLIIMLVFLLAHLRDAGLPKRQLLWLAPVVVTPLFMGETKAVVVMLPLAFFGLYRREMLRRPHVAMAGLLVGALLTAAAGYAYLSVTGKSLDELTEATLAHNVYEGGHAGYALNRTTVLTFWADEQGLHDPAGAVLGHGLGSAHMETGGSMARRYPAHGIGLTAASTLLWEQGVLGAGLFLAMLAMAWSAAGRLRRSANASWIRADAAAIQAVLPVFAFYLIYRSALTQNLPFQIVFYSLLGYLAWLLRRKVGESG